MLDPNIKTWFPGTQNITYLDTAAEGLPPRGFADALQAYAQDKNCGTPGRARLHEAEREVTAAAARLLGAPPEDVALLANASEALNLLANSPHWRPGEVLISDLEFPSNVAPWLRLRSAGVSLQVIATACGSVAFDDYLSRITPATRLVSVSLVSYKSGTQIPFLRELSQEVHRRGALLCVDATQALGRVPVSVEGVDFLVSSSYKWLLGSHGLAVVYATPAVCERLTHATSGWYSIRDLFSPHRFESYSPKRGAAALMPGMPNFPAIYALREGLNTILAEGPERIHAALQPLVRDLRQGLAERGFQLLTPAGGQFASGIVSFAYDRPEWLGSQLAAHGVVVWAGDGRVRVSMHLYNDRSDLENFFAALDAIHQAPLSRDTVATSGMSATRES
jgi:selenocysteine lyase/cysteine desulfurase